VGNHQHEEQVESKVKAAFNIGAVVSYEVEATGQQNVVVPTAADKPAFKKIANIERDFEQVKSVIEAEKEVCASLSCKAYTMKCEGNSWVNDKQIAVSTVSNVVETSYESYDLGDNIQPAKVNLNTGAPDQLARLPGIGESKAQSIDQYRKDEAEKAPGTTRFFATIADVAKVPGIGAGTVVALQTATSLIEL
jgi:competence ComEA-like helix-hairpin-helix protein